VSRARDLANLGDGITASDIPNLAGDKITSGTLGNTVQDNITRLGTVTTGTMNNTIGSNATFPAGNILQVVDAEVADVSTLATGMHDIISKTFTTKKANSKFILFGHTGGGFSGTGSCNFIMFFKRTVGGSNTDIGYFTTSNREGGVSAGQVSSAKGSEEPTTIAGMYLDDPSLAKDTSVQYHLRISVRDGTLTKHRVGSSSDSIWAHRFHSRIFIWELAV